MKKYCLLFSIILLFVLSYFLIRNVYIANKSGSINYSTFNSLLEKGTIEDSESILNIRLADITAMFGKHFKQSSYENGYYYDYDSILFFSDSNRSDALIGGFAIYDDRTIFGVKNQVTLEDAKKILGTPSYEGINKEISLWNLIYIYRNAELYLIAEDSTSPISLIILKRSGKLPLSSLQSPIVSATTK